MGRLRLTAGPAHFMANTMVDLMMGSQSQIVAATLSRAKDTVSGGFTTVRDVGGDTAGIKAANRRRRLLGRPGEASRPASSSTASAGTAPASRGAAAVPANGLGCHDGVHVYSHVDWRTRR